MMSERGDERPETWRGLAVKAVAKSMSGERSAAGVPTHNSAAL